MLVALVQVEFRNAKAKTQTGIKNVNSGAGTYGNVVDQAPQGRRIRKTSCRKPGLKHTKKIFSGIQQHLLECIQKCKAPAANHQYQSGNYTTHVYVDYVDGGVEGFNLGRQPFIPVRQADQTAF